MSSTADTSLRDTGITERTKSFAPYPIGSVQTVTSERVTMDSNRTINVESPRGRFSTNLTLQLAGFPEGDGSPGKTIITKEEKELLKDDATLRKKIVDDLSSLTGKQEPLTEVGFQKQITKSIAEYIDTKKQDPHLAELNDINSSLGLPGVGKMQLSLEGKPYNPNAPETRVGLPEQKLQAEERDLRQVLPNIYQDRPRGSAGSLQEVITGSDLSVFYVAEVYKIEDVIASPNSPWIWRKDILMMEFDTVMSISYSTLREVFPVRTLGQSKPKGFTRGPMSISGHVAFSVFTEDVLDRLRTQMLASIEGAKAKINSVISSRESTLNTGLAESRSNFSINQTDFRDARNKLNTSTEELEGKLPNLDEKTGEIQSEYDATNKKYVTANQSKSEWSALLSESRAEMEKFKAELIAKYGSLSSTAITPSEKASLQEFFRLVDSQQAEVDKRNTEVQKLTDELARLADELVKNDTAIKAVRANIAENVTKTTTLIDSYDSTYTKLEKDIDSKEDSLNQLDNHRALYQQNMLYERILRENSVYLLNQLGPFHLLVMGTNETGVFSKMMIKNVRVIDENQMQGVSQPNIVNRITFAAEDLVPMTSINANSNTDSTARNDMGKFGGNNLSLFTGSDIMRSVDYMTKNSSGNTMNRMRNF